MKNIVFLLILTTAAWADDEAPTRDLASVTDEAPPQKLAEYAGYADNTDPKVTDATAVYDYCPYPDHRCPRRYTTVDVGVNPGRVQAQAASLAAGTTVTNGSGENPTEK
jgi:hypothetical protein